MPKGRRKSAHLKLAKAPATPAQLPGSKKRPAPSPSASPRSPRRRVSAGATAALKKKQWLAGLEDAPHNSHVLLLDLDNWPTFFARMQWNALPDNVFIGACYRQETFDREAHCHQLHGRATEAMLASGRLVRVPSLSSKDSADSNIISLAKDVERVVQQRESDGLSRMWVTIISGDHIFKQTQETMSRSLPIMRCAERDYGHLAVLLAATGTCTLPPHRTLPPAGGAAASRSARASGPVAERQQKRARVATPGSCPAPPTRPQLAVSLAAQPAVPPRMAAFTATTTATTTAPPVSPWKPVLSTVQFNIGAKGATIAANAKGAAKAKGPGRGSGTVRRSRKRDRPVGGGLTLSTNLNPSKASAVTLGALIEAATAPAGVAEGAAKQSECEWPTLPAPSPVKLSFAQALASCKPSPSGAAVAGRHKVFRFGQGKRAAAPLQ